MDGRIEFGIDNRKILFISSYNGEEDVAGLDRLHSDGTWHIKRIRIRLLIAGFYFNFYY